MFTARENMRRCVKNEGPDRYVNQYEALKTCITPLSFHNPRPKRGEPDMVNAWGVTYSYPLNVPAGFPVHTPEKIVVKDIENWKEVGGKNQKIVAFQRPQNSGSQTPEAHGFR